jgi:hypothetical protein
MLRKIFGPRREKVTGCQRRLHNKELYNLYDAPNIIRVIKPKRRRSSGHVVCMEELRNAYSILVGKPEGKRPLGR